MNACRIKDAVECLPHIRFVQRRAGDRCEDPIRKRPADGDPRGTLAASPHPERRRQLMRQVNMPALMILRVVSTPRTRFRWTRTSRRRQLKSPHCSASSSPARMPVRNPHNSHGCHSGNRSRAMATRGAVSSFVNGSMIGSESSALRRHCPSRSAGFAGRSSSSSACVRIVLSVRAIPRTVLAFRSLARHCVTRSRQSARRMEPTSRDPSAGRMRRRKFSR